jgi:hypothetical protein
MAKLRFTKTGQTPNKKRFKRNIKIKKFIFRAFIFSVCVYIVDKENLIQIILDLLQ